MRKTNIEIEFKSGITEEKYFELLELFELENNVFKQTNYYFDTDELTLNSKHIVLRIRQKGNHYKVTLKKQSGNGAFEDHVLLSKDEAQNMIKNGFNTKEFFDDVDYFVEFRASLDNYRASVPYKDGILFIDRCLYHNIKDHEVEYEHNDYELGKEIFEQFLIDKNIDFVKVKRKSERALLTK